MVFVDANIPMYAGGAASPYKDRCREILSWIGEGRLDAATDAEVFQEILYRYHHIRRPDSGRIVFDSLKAVVERVLPVSADCIWLARDLADRYPALPPRDLLHVAVMRRHGIRQIVSVDAHFDAVAEVARLDPVTLPEPPALPAGQPG